MAQGKPSIVSADLSIKRWIAVDKIGSETEFSGEEVT